LQSWPRQALQADARSWTGSGAPLDRGSHVPRNGDDILAGAGHGRNGSILVGKSRPPQFAGVRFDFPTQGATQKPGEVVGGLVYHPARWARIEAIAGNLGETGMADFVKVAKTDEINPGQARLIDVRGKQIALFNINGEFFAIDNMCTHEEASLAEGEISGHE